MASHPIYQMYAELCDYRPKMWRRFQTMDHITMARLGYILMTLFEMKASHLFCFDVPTAENFRRHLYKRMDKEKADSLVDSLELEDQHIELIDEEDPPEWEGRLTDAAEAKLRQVLAEPGDAATFTYDFGDNWEISVTLEKIIEDEALPGKELPRVLEGAGYGIVEDCGGSGGLEEIAAAFSIRQGGRYEEYCEWLGITELNLDGFDLDDMNFRLKKVPRIYTDIYEYRLPPTKQSLDLLVRKYKRKK